VKKKDETRNDKSHSVIALHIRAVDTETRIVEDLWFCQEREEKSDDERRGMIRERRVRLVAFNNALHIRVVDTETRIA
jgi:hypothetical protein